MSILCTTWSPTRRPTGRRREKAPSRHRCRGNSARIPVEEPRVQHSIGRCALSVLPAWPCPVCWCTGNWDWSRGSPIWKLVVSFKKRRTFLSRGWRGKFRNSWRCSGLRWRRACFGSNETFRSATVHQVSLVSLLFKSCAVFHVGSLSLSLSLSFSRREDIWISVKKVLIFA